MEIISLTSIFIYVSFWEYMLIMYKLNPDTPYQGAFGTFAAIQWFIIGVALVHMYGWLYGLISLAATAMFLQYITHFTLGLAYSKIFSNPVVPLAFFVIMFWVNTGVTVALFL
mgnify:FL=1